MPHTQLLPADLPGSITQAAAILREGGLVAIPTDTLYGLAATVFRPDAVERVYEAKQRDPEARVPILIGSAADLPLLARSIPREVWKLIHAFWPGGLTLVLPARRSLHESLTRGGDTVAVRVPGARTALRLLEALGEPVVGTSANVSGQPPATTAGQVAAQLDGRIDAIVADDTSVFGGQPSTIVDFSGDMPVILRRGAIDPDAIRTTLGARVHVQNQLTDGRIRR
jgi:L-threonylcarbamoyladenylate synthase